MGATERAGARPNPSPAAIAAATAGLVTTRARAMLGFGCVAAGVLDIDAARVAVDVVVAVLGVVPTRCCCCCARSMAQQYASRWLICCQVYMCRLLS